MDDPRKRTDVDAYDVDMLFGSPIEVEADENGFLVAVEEPEEEAAEPVLMAVG